MRDNKNTTITKIAIAWYEQKKIINKLFYKYI